MEKEERPFWDPSIDEVEENPIWLGASLKEKNLCWSAAIEKLKATGRMPEFMAVQFAALRDIGGDPLSDEVLEFLFELLQQVKPRKGRHLPKYVIRLEYKTHLAWAQCRNPKNRLSGESPSDLIKIELANKYKASVSVIDQIVSPRKSRLPRKPRKP